MKWRSSPLLPDKFSRAHEALRLVAAPAFVVHHGRDIVPAQHSAKLVFEREEQLKFCSFVLFSYEKMAVVNPETTAQTTEVVLGWVSRCKIASSQRLG